MNKALLVGTIFILIGLVVSVAAAVDIINALSDGLKISQRFKMTSDYLTLTAMLMMTGASIYSLVYVGFIATDSLTSPKQYFYPCTECKNKVLFQLPDEYSKICECSNCGHPQDVPSEQQMKDYLSALK